MGLTTLVFEAEDTNNGLDSWIIRTPEDPLYLAKYDPTIFPDSPPVYNDKYLEYTGQFADKTRGNLTYTFTAPKTATYQMAMRLHSPILESDKADKKNDVFIKMEGNFTSGMQTITTEELGTLHKFFGRGKRRWGAGNFLEHKGLNPPLYNLIKGEEYTFTMNGRSPGTSIDYIAFFEPTALPGAIRNNDLALQLPTEMTPYIAPTSFDFSSNNEVRIGTSLQMEQVITPSNGNPYATWASTDDAIISVDQNGLITANGTVGQKATITATSKIDNSLIASKEIEIISFFAIPTTSVSITSTISQIVNSKTDFLTAEALPANADNKNIVWSSSDESIATISSDGQVNTVAPGMVTIRATSAENNAVFDETTVEIVEFFSSQASFTNATELRDGPYYNKGNMTVNIDYHAGSLNTIESIRIRLRQINATGGTVKSNITDVFFTDVSGTTTGPKSLDFPLDGLKTSASLPVDHKYQLQIQMKNSAGQTINTTIQPITILDKDLLSIDKLFFTEKANLYPNPADENVFIDLKTRSAESTVSIYSINGVQVYANDFNTKNMKINTSNLNPGIYILRLKNGNTIASQKLILK